MLYKEVFVLIVAVLCFSHVESSFSCKGLRDGQTFPHLTECNLHYKCLNEKLTLAQCHSNFWWDFKRKMCLPKVVASCIVKEQPEIEVTSEISIPEIESSESNESNESVNSSGKDNSESHSDSHESSENSLSSSEHSSSESQESSEESNKSDSLEHSESHESSDNSESHEHSESREHSGSHESSEKSESLEHSESQESSEKSESQESSEKLESNENSESQESSEKSESNENSNESKNGHSEITTILEETTIIIPDAPTPTTVKPPTTPQVDFVQCPPSGVSTLPHKLSCSKYVICFDGTPLVKDCAPGLHFDTKKSQCTFPELTSCHIFDHICPRNDSAQNIFYIADKFDCSKYYYCYNGNAYEQTCSEGLFWDSVNNWCTRKDEAQCEIFHPFQIVEGTSRQYAKVCSDRQSTYWKAHSMDKQHYFLCHLGDPWLKKCDEGLLWDAQIESCNFKEKCVKYD